MRFLPGTCLSSSYYACRATPSITTSLSCRRFESVLVRVLRHVASLLLLKRVTVCFAPPSCVQLVYMARQMCQSSLIAC